MDLKNWPEEQIRYQEDAFKAMPEQRRNQLDAMALQIFCWSKMLGLASADLPEVATHLTREQTARLRQLALHVDLTCQLYGGAR
jgi:hypothetical protein